MGKRISEHKDFSTRLKRRIRNARRWVYAGLARCATFVLIRLPFPVLRGFCRVLIRTVGKLLHGRVAEQQLITAFGDRLSPERRKVVIDAMFTNMADLPAEVFAAVRRGKPFLASRVLPGPGLDKWRALQERYRSGLIGVTGHLGNWELLLQILHVNGARPFGGAVAKRIPNPRLNKLVEELRGAFGVPTLYGDSGVTTMARVLGRGETLGLVPDQDIEELGGLFVEFMGRPAYTPIGPARLSLATGAPIVVVFARRVDGDRLEVVINDPIEPDRKAPRAQEIARITQAWSAQIEAFIAQHPEQWMWFHDRWKTTPADLEARRRDFEAETEAGGAAAG